ncbi:tyrosine-type recombinase/integrase [Psychrobacillus lasiicapitis]|uniref:Recombinase XerC n=1 Tax=Psychrobacillus lasiicapitis TaxID=1636719 RepID=A0A544TGZ7_9BACI|nr:tyrosine-type recombinase/integrase [Psychrobacillus lasiicapitis]TQR16732.1 recombinase XerC [Psychrobacillus lasiicapitis]GGA27669.1 tyrosine recombinase XerC [Psychrobacillus lasiicapitis]
MPKIVKDFLVYLTTIKGKSMRTRKEYEYDIVLFLRFLKALENDIDPAKMEDIDLKDISIDFIREISLEDIYLFLEFCEVKRGNSAATRARKAATIKSFFKYLKGKRRLIEENVADELETPKIGKKKPIYMNQEDAEIFIKGIKRNNHYYRNYAMIMFFLNLGLRVSELCSLNLNSIQDRILHVIGKGDKERTVFLNNVCIQSLEVYMLKERKYIQGANTNEALFLSQKGTRLTRQTVAKIVKQINADSGLNKEKLTPHKLRHTSATIMYKNGADIRSLQHILGHTSVSTTQIYTHVEDKEIQQVIENNPFNQLG